LTVSEKEPVKAGKRSISMSPYWPLGVLVVMALAIVYFTPRDKGSMLAESVEAKTFTFVHPGGPRMLNEHEHIEAGTKVVHFENASAGVGMCLVEFESIDLDAYRTMYTWAKLPCSKLRR
jgi:hypothetical protein